MLVECDRPITFLCTFLWIFMTTVDLGYMAALLINYLNLDDHTFLSQLFT